EAAASDAVVSRRLRKAVPGRDGYRCRASPSARSLMVHHVQWRCRGGATALANLVTLCARCHGLVHDGWLRIERGEDGELRFADRQGRALDAAYAEFGRRSGSRAQWRT